MNDGLSRPLFASEESLSAAMREFRRRFLLFITIVMGNAVLFALILVWMFAPLWIELLYTFSLFVLGLSLLLIVVKPEFGRKVFGQWVGDRMMQLEMHYSSAVEILVTLLMVLTLSSLLVVPIGMQTVNPGVVVNSTVNVYSGPGTNYSIIGQANQGTRYTVTGRNNDGSWYQIDFNGGAGWVFSDLVTSEGPFVTVAFNIPTPPPTNTPVPVTVTPSVAVDSTINVRSGPGTNYDIIGQANQGTRYTVTSRSSDGSWYQIDFNGIVGWVFSDLVTFEGPFVAVAANIPPPPPPNTPMLVLTASAPSPTASPSARYEFNTVVVGPCDRQPASTGFADPWFEGTIYKAGQPANGYDVVYSYFPDGPWLTQAAISGPDDGYYRQVVGARFPVNFEFYVWIVDGDGSRISEMATLRLHRGCNHFVVDFDSR